MKSNKEEVVADFIEQLMKEESPEYHKLRGDSNLLSIADVVLFLKKGDETPDENFKKDLEDEFLSKFRKEKIVNDELERLGKDKFTRFAVGFASVLLIMAGIAGLRVPRFSAVPKNTNISKMDIVRISERRINRERAMLSYNKLNYAMLYWSSGQFKMLQ